MITVPQICYMLYCFNIIVDDAGLERYLTGSLPEGVADYNAKEQWIYAICLINYTTVVK